MFSDASIISADLDALSEITALIEMRAITCVLQPVVRMSTGEIVGYEALARGPRGTRWESPVELFRAASAIGRVGELDWLCRARAMEAAIAARLPKTAVLFINVDPVSISEPCPRDLRPIIARAGTRVRVLLELTERSISRDPAALLSAASASRSEGFALGIDNVGGDPSVLAVMPLVRPEVVKFDPYVLRTPLRAETAHLVEAVNEYATATGAVIAAVGIETEKHRHIARSMGATIGQGWLFGRPDLLDNRPNSPREPIAGLRPFAMKRGSKRADGSAPFDIVAAQRRVSRTSSGMLLPIVRRLESAGLDSTEPVIVLSYLHQHDALSTDHREWYAALARSSAILVVGRDEHGQLDPGDWLGKEVVTATIRQDDPMAGDWTVLVLGQHIAGAMVARRPKRRGGRVLEDRMDFAVTYNRDLVLTAARCLLDRIG